eukprot:jgi/Galph1/630/GphlegSOOS_G5342.1
MGAGEYERQVLFFAVGQCTSNFVKVGNWKISSSLVCNKRLIVPCCANIRKTLYPSLMFLQSRHRSDSWSSLRGRFLPTAFDLERTSLTPGEVAFGEELENPETAAEREKLGIVRCFVVGTSLKSSETVYWNQRSKIARLRWENDEVFREKKRQWLKEGAKTRKAKKPKKEILESPTKRSYHMSAEGQLRKSEKLRKRHRNVVEWMQERLDSGEETRRRIFDVEYKQELARKRSELAKKRYKKRIENLKRREQG